MAHFAKVENGMVTQVIVAVPAFINLLPDFDSWIQTSYNTFGGIHKLGGTPLRKNYAGVGYTYDSAKDAFIPPKEYNSWVLNEETCLWEPPIEYPNDEKIYKWNEEITNWEEVIIE
jgi:hypothetical protein